MPGIIVWLCIGLALGLASLILPHSRRALASIVQVGSAIVGAVAVALLGSALHLHEGIAHPSSFGFAFVGAVVFALAAVVIQARAVRRASVQ